MKLTPIPISCAPVQHPRNSYTRPQSVAVDDPTLWFSQLRRTNSIAECEAIKAHAYANQWKVK